MEGWRFFLEDGYSIDWPVTANEKLHNLNYWYNIWIGKVNSDRYKRALIINHLPSNDTKGNIYTEKGKDYSEHIGDDTTIQKSVACSDCVTAMCIGNRYMVSINCGTVKNNSVTGGFQMKHSVLSGNKEEILLSSVFKVPLQNNKKSRYTTTSWRETPIDHDWILISSNAKMKSHNISMYLRYKFDEDCIYLQIKVKTYITNALDINIYNKYPIHFIFDVNDPDVDSSNVPVLVGEYQKGGGSLYEALNYVFSRSTEYDNTLKFEHSIDDIKGHGLTCGWYDSWLNPTEFADDTDWLDGNHTVVLS